MLNPPLLALQTAKWATRTQFFILGGAAGAWGAHIPSVKAHYAISEGGLALALLVAAVGAVFSLVKAGSLVSTLGARRVSQCTAPLLALALALALATPYFAVLLVAMLFFGAGAALFDVAINAEGAYIEERTGRKVMSGFHGMFSLGGMAGAGLMAYLIHAGILPLAQLLWTSVAIISVAYGASLFMLPAQPKAADLPSGYQFPRGVLALLGLLAALGMLAEGAMYDWSVLYMRQETGALPALAALGYASFSGAMAATRFVGDWLRTHLSPAHLLSGSAVLAALAMAVVLLARQPTVALLGFALVGVGFANIVPILFMAASRVPGVAPSSAIASVSSVGFLGFVAGPPLIGAIAQAASLSWALSAVVVGAVLIAWLALRLPKP